MHRHAGARWCIKLGNPCTKTPQYIYIYIYIYCFRCIALMWESIWITNAALQTNIEAWFSRQGLGFGERVRPGLCLGRDRYGLDTC